MREWCLGGEYLPGLVRYIDTGLREPLTSYILRLMKFLKREFWCCIFFSFLLAIILMLIGCSGIIEMYEGSWCKIILLLQDTFLNFIDKKQFLIRKMFDKFIL